MVFGLSRKEHKVPDLSRYDYYYQNNQDFNRSARLSAAAASAASNGGNRRVVSAQPTHQSRQQTRSNSLIHSKDPQRRASSVIPPRMNSTISSRPRVKVKNPNYKTYSLRSESSEDQIGPSIRSKSVVKGTKMKNSNNNNNNKITMNKKDTRSGTQNSIHTTNTNIQKQPQQPKKKKIIKKPAVTTSRLNSIASNNSTNRQLRKMSMSDSRSNSITTQITKVKDPQGRTTSITRKTIKRIDGYEYIETTTTTTTVAPVNETESIDSNQRHFDEFNDDYIMDNDFAPIQDIQEETENEDSPQIDEVMLQEESLTPSLHGSLNVNDDTPHIEEPLAAIADSTELSNVSPIPESLVDDQDSSLNQHDEEDDDDDTDDADEIYKSQDPELSETATSDENVPGTFEYDYTNPYVETEGTEETEETANNEDDHELVEEQHISTEKRPAHPYAQQTLIQPLSRPYINDPDQVVQSQSSNTIFSDALEEIPGANVDDTIQYAKHNTPKSQIKSKSRPKNNRISVNKSNKQTKRTQRETQSIEIQRNDVNQHQNVARKKTVKPKKPLTEAEMYQKALEIATKKVYSDRLPSTNVKKPSKSMMGQRMTLRNEEPNGNNMMSHSQHQAAPNVSPKKHKRLSLFSFEKHHDEPEHGNNTVPLPTNSAALINKETHPIPLKEAVQAKEPSEIKSSMSDADMYAKALEVAQRKYRDAHYIQNSGIPVNTSNMSANSGFSSGIRSNSIGNNIPNDAAGRLSLNDQLSKTTTGSARRQDVTSNVSFLRNEPVSNTESGGGMRLSIDSKKKMNDSSYEARNGDEAVAVVNHNVSIPENYIPVTASSAIVRPAIVTTVPEPNRYITTDIDHNITTVSNNTDNISTDFAKGHPMQKSQTNDSAKHRSKFKHFVDKVVQFSTENSGYQLSKDEQYRLQGQKGSNGEDVGEGRNFLNVTPPQHQLSAVPIVQPPVTYVEPTSVSRIPITTVGSESSFQRKNITNNSNMDNGNTSATLNTVSSSIFSKDKGPVDVSPPQTSSNYIPNEISTHEPLKKGSSLPRTLDQGHAKTFQQANNNSVGMDRIITPVTVVANNVATVETHTKSVPVPTSPPKKKGFFKKLFKR
ncbi:similar to Saccharomyces cerevisiae YLR219W MSC3 Protein of unknown function, green fluorescent protein (GFP)-fusion protein localizes to the cell periphery [Maudiozyma saulgeensis]|uniref:Uncharacterized protein n=1 Tax=Maudiozyma saulgeensis TaxID=1789683 RepID=A0A1X7RAV3_9SACH|nr:similar to Saccharomyces cerevisiae YLR219W MSC3 Protein of unknown function, green fluorescent protein (GFP)-fusion protein localizes to the cell periphery [Kazachstania saulgeensis]